MCHFHEGGGGGAINTGSMNTLNSLSTPALGPVPAEASQPKEGHQTSSRGESVCGGEEHVASTPRACLSFSIHVKGAVN